MDICERALTSSSASPGTLVAVNDLAPHFRHTVLRAASKPRVRDRDKEYMSAPKKIMYGVCPQKSAEKVCGLLLQCSEFNLPWVSFFCREHRELQHRLPITQDPRTVCTTHWIPLRAFYRVFLFIAQATTGDVVCFDQHAEEEHHRTTGAQVSCRDFLFW